MNSGNERIKTILREVRGPRILHIGCVGKVPDGSLREKHHLHVQLCRSFPGADVVGIDLNEAGILEMKQQGFNVLCLNAERMNFEEPFDTILAGELIEHLSNPGTFLERCSRSLKPSGKLILSTPNILSLMYFLLYLKNYPHAFHPQHSLWFCSQTLSEMVRRAGLRRESLRFVDDLEPDEVGSSAYRGFAYAWRALRPVMPARLRNTIVWVGSRQ